MTDAAARTRARCVQRGDCLVWTGATNGDGYGVIRLSAPDRRLAYVHRVIYEAEVGPIPDGMTIDHVAARGCAFKACCNADHMEVVTQAENNRRAHAVLSPAQVAEARASAEPNPVVAARFGVEPQTISKIRTGTTWSQEAA